MSFSKYTGVGGGTNGIPIYPNLAGFPAVANDGEQGVAADTDTIYIYNSSIPGWNAVATPPVGVFISSLTTDVTATGPGAAVATISNSAVTNAKMANMNNNTVKGNKSGLAAAPSDLTLSSLTEATSSVLTISNGSNTIVGSSNLTIQVKQSSAVQDGYLSSTDWTTFNNKQPAGTYVTSVGATAPVASSGGTTPTISMPVATALADGYLSSANFTTFNNAATTVSNATALSTPSTLMSRDVNGETALDGLSLDGSTSGAIKLQAAATTTPYTVKMPSAQGAATTFLQNDGSGNLSWTAAATFPSQTGNQYKVLATSGSATSWQFAGLGDGTLPSNTVILGRDLPSGMTATSGILIGTGSNLGTGASQVIIGASSGRSTTGATGANNTVVGAGSFNAAGLTSAANNVIIGQGNSIAITTHSGGVFIGKDCAKAITTGGGTGGNGNVAIGQNCLPAATTNIFGSVFIGDDAATHATAPSYTVAIGSIVGNNAAMGVGVLVGHRASGSGASLVLVGSNTASGTNTGATAIGSNASVTGNYGVALGYFSTAGANQFTCGGATGYISQVTFGRGLGVQFPNIPLLITNSRTVTGWTNADGSAGTLTLTPSNSTGNVPGGDLIVETCPSGASGSTVNAYVERLRIKALTEVVVNDTGVDFDFRVEGDTDANLLFVDAGTDRVGIGNNAPAVKLHTQATTAATNTVTNVLRVDSQSSGTPANGIGVGIEMAAETGVGNTEIGVVLEAVTNDVTSTSEDFDFVVKTMAAGATAAERLKVGSNGTVTVANGDLVLNTAGNGLNIKEGTNARLGVTGAFPASNPNTVTVSTTEVTANSRIFLTIQNYAGAHPCVVYVSAVTAGTSFVITAADTNFDGTVAWMIVEPA